MDGTVVVVVVALAEEMSWQADDNSVVCMGRWALAVGLERLAVASVQMAAGHTWWASTV